VHTKFEVSGFIHFKDIKGASKCTEMGSYGHKYAVVLDARFLG